jgi:hypothetical protein
MPCGRCVYMRNILHLPLGWLNLVHEDAEVFGNKLKCRLCGTV